jgi:coenzyme F420-0:L-glutamate ligase
VAEAGDQPEPISIRPVLGIGEIRPGDDLAGLLCAAAPWLADGDVLVVTSKIVSKAENRLLAVPGGTAAEREAVRQRAIAAETRRVVARRGEMQIVQNAQGVVMAGAGVDASNVSLQEIALLPADPDRSARALRNGVRQVLGVSVGVIISDSLGRAWRAGIIDQALGVAGLSAVHDLRGTVDAYGNELRATEIAVADELASAADLVKGKLTGVPVAVIRGLAPRFAHDDGRGSAPLIRGGAEDMFALGTKEALDIGRADGAGSMSAPGPLHADALAAIAAMPVPDAEMAAVREAYIGYLLARPDAMWRSCVSGHLTASTVVIDPSRNAVLLTLHPRLRRWVQLGGHCEPGDVSLSAAALREAREESGIAELELDPVPVDLDVHPVTCSLGLPTRHYDVRFVARTRPGAEAVISDESLDLRWFDWNDLPADVAADLGRVLSAARARLDQP